MSHSEFNLVESTEVGAFGVTYSQFVHQRTGARHLHLDCDDRHNAFMIAFPTLPRDSTGVAHILEHTTLCGSARYPVRDPFFMMLRRSLNTYMNAFTSGDSTAYPFATQNHKDFDNLLGVYLDAVFFPRLHPLDFAQEGWRAEVADGADGSGLEFHGVVYNEMKGAMSSPMSQLWQHVHSALFPDAVYHHNSGGDPLAIPDLTHADLCAFHARHYHPANAVIMTYGDLPAAQHQANFERLALRQFDGPREPIVSPAQPAFKTPRVSEVSYAVDSVQAEQTHIVWAWIVGDTANADDYMEAHLMSSVLLEHGASPLRHYLESTPLANAPSELCGVDDSSRHLVFVCGVEGSEATRAEQLEGDVVAVIQRVAEEGISSTALSGIVDRLELAQRDLGGGSYPFGLQLMGRMMPPAMYRADILSLLDLGPAIERLREKLRDPGFVQELFRRRLLQNTHRVRVVMNPDPQKAANDQAREEQRLNAIRATLDEAGVEQIREQAQALLKRQAEIDDDDILPRVGLNDVPPAKPLQQPEPSVGGAVPADCYECASNGVFRIKLAYQLPRLSTAELKVLPLWCEYITEFGHLKEDYLAVQARRALAGHFSVYALTRPQLDDPGKSHAWLLVGGMGLARKRSQVVDIVHEIVTGARFDETQRLHELLAQSRAEAEQSITDRGHQLAVLSAARGFSASAALDELWDGPSAIATVVSLAQGKAAASVPQRDELFTLFQSIQQKILAAPRRVALIGEADALGDAQSMCEAYSTASGTDFAPFVIDVPMSGSDDAWITNSQVSFCAKAYAAAAAGSADAPVLSVLGRYLQDGFLHREIREQGGAYGSGASFDADSATFRFFSYRDPRTIDTFSDFDRALSWYVNNEDSQRLEESILGTIRALDQPRAPAGEADRAFIAGLCGRDDAFRSDFRRRVLAVSFSDLVNVGQRYLNPERAQRAIISGPQSESVLAQAGFKLGRI